METLDVTKTFGAGNHHDILPFLISLKDIHRYPGEFSDQIPVFKYLPHDENVLYHIAYVKKVDERFFSLTRPVTLGLDYLPVHLL